MPVPKGRITCTQCQLLFRSRDRRQKKFCSLTCCWAWRKGNKDQLKGTFKQGITPWNTGTKGVMKPNSGTFKPGRPNDKWVPIGTVTTRKDKGIESHVRAWVKVADNGTSYDWKLRAVVEWEKAYGPVPAGKVVHHKDRNKLNDDVSNLELMSRAEHIVEHRHEHEEKRSSAASEATKRRHAANRAKRGAI